MDLAGAISEPLIALIKFHDQFNRNIKLTIGSLAYVHERSAAPGGQEGPIELPTSTEPWGNATNWRNLDQSIRNAAIFVAELGLIRAASAFEDYRTRAKSELDRAAAPDGEGAAGTTAALMDLPEIHVGAIADLKQMVEFFDIARNCIVHRSNRASRQLEVIRQSDDFAGALERWPRRSGKWRFGVPDINEGANVEWRPRHAIMASDAYYHCAVALDHAVVARLGEVGIVNMAAHWCFFAEHPVPCPAKRNPETMLRSQLMMRYRVREVARGEPVAILRQSGHWEDARIAYAQRYLSAPVAGSGRR